MTDKMLLNLATGLEDPEGVTVAFLVGTAGVQQGKAVAMFLTKEAVRLGLPGHANGVACDGCAPLGRLFEQYTDRGGELLVCPICSTRANSTRPRSRKTPSWPARPRCSNG
jgi:predicted peroxiredoxin